MRRVIVNGLQKFHSLIDTDNKEIISVLSNSFVSSRYSPFNPFTRLFPPLLLINQHFGSSSRILLESFNRFCPNSVNLILIDEFISMFPLASHRVIYILYMCVFRVREVRCTHSSLFPHPRGQSESVLANSDTFP